MITDFHAIKRDLRVIKMMLYINLVMSFLMVVKLFV